jgi:Tol biopolymer transport system component
VGIERFRPFWQARKFWFVRVDGFDGEGFRLKSASGFSTVVAAAALLCAVAGFGQAGAVQQGAGQAGALGIFESQSDVGMVHPAGSASFESASGIYSIASSGANLWSTTDGFHLVWKKMSGDLSLTADIELGAASAGSNPHRKALLMFRQTLDADSMYADVAVHGSGETALQYRRAKGDATQDIAFELGDPRTVRLEKRGDTITLFVSMKGEPPHQAGASIKLHLAEPFYVGLGVCAHQDGAVEKATFAHVELKPLAAPQSPAPMALYSTLQTIATDNAARMAYVIVTGKGHMEAPNWSRDGKALIFNRDGKLWTVPVAGGEPSAIDIGGATDCSGSHGLSPDGKWLAMTCVTPGQPGRRVYIVPSSGGTPRMVTTNPNSYFHSWSPDGKTILFTRSTNGSLNIYAIPTEGGEEKALTSGTGTTDDPDYSPDGQYIYFNSDRAGGMEIFRMRPDGSNVEQMTSDERRNWTAHPSPDGKSVLILSYASDVTTHAANKDVTLRILDVGTKKVRDLVEIVGGSGTDNVPNWAPDGAHFAFVSYQMLPAEDTGSSE